jgi:hypothetical protein
MHPDNTVICQVKISRAAMKAAQEAKSCKSTCKGKKNNIFSIMSKHQFHNWFFYAILDWLDSKI